MTVTVGMLMGGVADSKTIDLIGSREDVDEVFLIMVETRPWGDRGELLLDLQEKFHTYLDFVESGQLTARFPDAAGKRVRICLESAHPLGPLEEKFLTNARHVWLNPLGIELETGLLCENEQSLTSSQKEVRLG